VYDPGYNITLLGLEKLHPFDSCKFSKVNIATSKVLLLLLWLSFVAAAAAAAAAAACMKQGARVRMCGV
jgi:hypothetical protein